MTRRTRSAAVVRQGFSPRARQSWARFGLVMAWSDALKAAGRTGAARRLYEGEAERCRARAAALRAGRG